MRKLRIKILKKIAESTASPAPSMPMASPAPSAKQPGDTQDSESESESRAPSAPSFSASNKYSLFQGFNQNVVNQIDKFINYLNQVLFYASNGLYTINQLAQNNFIISKTPRDNQVKLLLQFCKDVYFWLLNNGVAYKEKLNKEAVQYKIDKLLSSYSLNNLSQVNISGPLAAKVGNIKNNFINTLVLIKNIDAD